MEAVKTLACAICREVVPRRGPTQRYCAACSKSRDLERKRLWGRAHPPSEGVARAKVAALGRVAELAKDAGRQRNAEVKMSILWDGHSGPDLLWQVSIAVPFSYAVSKNHIYTLRRNGHVALRRQSRDIRDLITHRLRTALADQKVAHNKLWIDILVQKPDHRGDAVNAVDLVCDAIKAAVPIDDRWFCLRRVDWEIAKDNPKLFLKVGQETDSDCQVCSFCGQIRPFPDFNKRRQNRLGIDRVCKMCRRDGRAQSKSELQKSLSRVLASDPKPRTCLKCGQLFPSRGPGHRFCPPCSQRNAQLRLSEAELQRQRGAKRHNGELLLPPIDGGRLA